MTEYQTEKTTIYCTGDIHGNFGTLLNFSSRKLSDCAVVCCGDIGMGFHKRQYYDNMFAEMNRRLADKGVEFYMLRGNHDDPSYFEEAYDNGIIHLVPDYSVLSTGNGKHVLMVGGATSIDRMDRIAFDLKNKHKYLLHHPGVGTVPTTYWPAEGPVYNAISLGEMVKAGITVDMVCTHTCPSFCHPTDKEGLRPFLDRDTSLEIEIDNEREVMDKIYRWLCDNGMRPGTWCYGHYHRHNFEVIDGTRFVLLDMCDENRNRLDVYEAVLE